MKDFALDKIAQTNNHTLILGQERAGKTYAGKTYAVKIEVTKQLKKGKPVFVFDFRNEYEDICEQLNGHKWNVGEKELPNIMDGKWQYEGEEYGTSLFTEHLVRVTDTLLLLLEREASKEERLFLTNYLEKYYLSESAYSFDSFLLYIQSEVTSLHNELQRYEGLFSSEPVTFSFEAQFNVICIERNKWSHAINDAVLFALLHFVRTHNRTRSNGSLVVYDEVERFFASSILYQALVRLIRTYRRYNLSYLFTAKSFAELYKERGDLIMNTDTKVFLTQMEKEVACIKEWVPEIQYFSRYAHRLSLMPKGAAVVVNHIVCDVWIRP